MVGVSCRSARSAWMVAVAASSVVVAGVVSTWVIRLGASGTQVSVRWTLYPSGGGLPLLAVAHVGIVGGAPQDRAGRQLPRAAPDEILSLAAILLLPDLAQALHRGER